MFFAQAKRRFIGGKWFAKIISPGIPNSQPWNIGISPPISPIITRIIPSDICKALRTIKAEKKGGRKEIRGYNNRKYTKSFR